MRRLGWGFLIAGLLAWPVARLLDARYGADVTLMTRIRTPAQRDSWRLSGWRPEEGVAALYGTAEPAGRLRLLCFDRTKLVRPDEDPSLALLPLGEGGVRDVLTCRTFRFRAALVGLALGLLGALILARERRLGGAAGHE